MDAIYGVTKELLAELTSKYTELKARYGERLAEAEFDRYLAGKGLNRSTWAHAHNGWQDRFRADPTGRAEAEFHMLLAQLSQKAHFGDVRDMSQDVVEGITLDQYAQITVAVSREGADADAVVRRFGLAGVSHWQRANAAWSAKMGADTAHALSMQYGQLYQKYAGPSFQQQTMERTAAILAEAHRPRDVVREPEVELTPELCLQKMQSPSRNERWKYARLYATRTELGNVPDKAAAIRNVAPHLLEMIENHDEHTTSDAEQAVNQLWDLEVRNDDVRGAVMRCLHRAREKLASLQAAFAPIQDRAVPERITLQTRIQDYTSLVQTMQDFAGRDWSPAPLRPYAPSAFPPPGMSVSTPPKPSRGSPVWLLAPVLLVLAIGGVAVTKVRAARAAAAIAAATPAAVASSASAPKLSPPAPPSVTSVVTSAPAAAAPAASSAGTPARAKGKGKKK